MFHRGGKFLYLAWKFDGAADRARRVSASLAQGEQQCLYRLRSWVVLEGEVRALLAPEAPLEAIAGIVQQDCAEPFASRWIGSARDCASVAREIENAPVSLGLADRPEKWPLSSAARE